MCLDVDPDTEHHETSSPQGECGIMVYIPIAKAAVSKKDGHENCSKRRGLRKVRKEDKKKTKMKNIVGSSVGTISKASQLIVSLLSLDCFAYHGLLIVIKSGQLSEDAVRYTH